MKKPAKKKLALTAAVVRSLGNDQLKTIDGAAAATHVRGECPSDNGCMRVHI